MPDESRAGPQSDDLRDFAHLTFPAYRHLLRSATLTGALHATLRATDGTPIGLAVGMSEGDCARLLSLNINAVEAERACAEALLLRQFAGRAHRRGLARVVAAVPLAGGDPSLQQLASLSGGRWSRLTGSTLVMRSTLQTLAAALGERRVPRYPSLALHRWSFAWGDPDWSPAELAPSRFAPSAPDGRPLCRSASFAVVGGDRLRGWFLCHDMGEGWLRLTSHYLHSRLAFPQLWADFLRRTQRQGWTSITFSTNSRYQEFQRFCRRRVVPLCDWWQETADFETDCSVLAG